MEIRGSEEEWRPSRPQHSLNQLKKRTCKIVDFAVPADHRIKLKENEKKEG